MEKKPLTLTQLMSEGRRLANVVLEEAYENMGEISEKTEFLIENNGMDLQDKVESYAMVIERFNIEVKMLKEKEKELSAIRKTIEATEKGLKNMLKFNLESAKEDKLEGHTVYYKMVSTRPSLVIHDEKKVPDEFKTQVISTEINKDDILDNLKNGFDVEGCELKEGYALRRYIRRGNNAKKIENKKSN